MCFDTTSSNTGRHRGACTRLESGYRKDKVFWFGCRHHVIEPIAKVVWYLLFEDNQGPDKKTYQGGKDMWGDLDTLSTAQIKKLVVRSPFVQKLKSDATEFYEKVFTEKHRNQTLPRDNYRELAESSLILLGGIPPGGISWKKPGPVHKARFMANGLYSNKMFAFQEVLDYDVEDVSALRRFVLFNVLLYAPQFLSAGVGADAPINDLVFFKHLCKFRSIDAELSATALNVLRRHLWYLSQEVVIFSLFSNKVSNDEKSRIAARLLTFPVPSEFPLGQPEFPDILENTQLVDLVGPKSWFIFLKLKIDASWLERDVASWSANLEFQKIENFVRTVKTTNDTAERGVKLMTDYAQILTHDEDMRQWILQAVDNNRKMFPDFNKNTLNS